MDENPFPYRHRLAVEAPWLLTTLRDAVTNHRAQLEIRRSIATLQGEDTRPYTRDICYANAALEQLLQERNHHATP